MTITEKSRGLLSTVHGTLDAMNSRGVNTFPVYDEDYVGGVAVGCNTGNSVVWDSGEISAGDLSGLYNLLIKWYTDHGFDIGTPIFELEIYKDGVKETFDVEDDTDGKILIPFGGVIHTGSFLTLYFEPTATYKLVITSRPEIDGNTIVLDYLKFIPTIQSQKQAGTYFWSTIFEEEIGVESVLGNGTSEVTKTVATFHDYYEIMSAYAVPSGSWTGGGSPTTTYKSINIQPYIEYDATNENQTGNVVFRLKHKDGSNFSDNIYFGYVITGRIRPPTVRHTDLD